jgi:hypothetical protein
MLKFNQEVDDFFENSALVCEEEVNLASDFSYGVQSSDPPFIPALQELYITS